MTAKILLTFIGLASGVQTTSSTAAPVGHDLGGDDASFICTNRDAPQGGRFLIAADAQSGIWPAGFNGDDFPETLTFTCVASPSTQGIEDADPLAAGYALSWRCVDVQKPTRVVLAWNGGAQQAHSFPNFGKQFIQYFDTNEMHAVPCREGASGGDEGSH